MQVKFTGRYEKKLYENTSNGWGVYLFYDEARDRMEKVVGIPSCVLLEDAEYQITGIEKFVETYGKQINLSSIELMDNPTIALMQRFFDGIGPKTAQRLYTDLGDTCLERLIESPESIKKSPYISSRNKEKIIASLRRANRRDLKLSLKILTFFHGNISSLQLSRIVDYCFYGREISEEDKETMRPVEEEKAEQRWGKITENPYDLISMIPYFQFRRADRLAIQAGIARDADIRIAAVILYAMKTKTSQTGSVCLAAEEIYATAAGELMPSNCQMTGKRKRQLVSSFLHENEEEWGAATEDERKFVVYLKKIAEIIDTITDTEDNIERDKTKIVKSKEDYYLLQDYKEERFCADNITRLFDFPIKTNKRLKNKIETYFKLSEVSYTDEQKEGIRNALLEHISILTGGPGTGKTSALHAIVEIAGMENVILLAPTGKAAERISAVTINGHAMTIHKFCTMVETGAITKPTKKLIVVDEVSMVGQPLLCRLFLNTSWMCNFLFVGDANQLSSIDKGKILEDMIQSGKIPVTNLTKCLRSNDAIARNSDFVLRRHPFGTYIEDDRCRWITMYGNGDKQIALDYILKLYARLSGIYGRSETCILVPFRHTQSAGIITTTMINEKLHEMNPNPVIREMPRWKQGDRIIVQHNCYNIYTDGSDTSIYNGDAGYIGEYSKRLNRLHIILDTGKNAWLTSDEMDDYVDYGYAITIHKAQGSEYNAVLVVAEQMGSFVTRKMLYTAVSRPKKCLVVLQYEGAVDSIVANDINWVKRKTHLAERLQNTSDN